MRPELFFGIVAAVGTDSHRTCDVLSESLATVGYQTKVISVTGALQSLRRYSRLKTTHVDEYYSSLMEAGDDFCQRTGAPDAMAALGVRAIREARGAINGGDQETPLEKIAYVVRSLKRPAEVELLRETYGDRFSLVAAYASRTSRVGSLAARIAESYGSARSENYRDRAEYLVSIDENEDVDYGQDVRGTFPLADVFVDASSTGVHGSMARFIEILFDNPFRTPSLDEYGMFLAFGASRRSADLARQVGACALDPHGSVLALGTNDAPKANGGLYWEGDPDDGRDFRIEYDASYRRRVQMVSDVLDRLKDAGWLSSQAKRRSSQSLVKEALEGDTPILRDAQLMDVIEFGRSVHAEMTVISDAAARGTPLRGATLYSTTFPCHNCARHIVAAGFGRVVYIEPYPKSLAYEMYSDAITVDGSASQGGKVQFEPYRGIGPRVYLELFSAGKRKDDTGAVIRWEAQNAEPKLPRPLTTYSPAEQIVVDDIEQAMKSARMS